MAMKSMDGAPAPGHKGTMQHRTVKVGNLS